VEANRRCHHGWLVFESSRCITGCRRLARVATEGTTFTKKTGQTEIHS
jgi:hypothetical protein